VPSASSATSSAAARRSAGVRTTTQNPAGAV
jgi:hypothetical protein